MKEVVGRQLLDDPKSNVARGSGELKRSVMRGNVPVVAELNLQPHPVFQNSYSF